MTRKPPSRSVSLEASGITPERFTRLFRLLTLLGQAPQTRATLIRRLRTDVRGFYRDLELLRQNGITVRLEEQRYHLDGNSEAVLKQLPFPDPHLTYGEMQQVAKGRTAAHDKLRARLEELTP
jgi:hypothetical protein